MLMRSLVCHDRAVRLISLVAAFATAILAEVLPADAATYYYVDNGVAESGDGSSWSKAWKAFSEIEWWKVHAGDTIYVSGGASGRTYSGPLEVGADGLEGAPITISGASGPGRNGRVVVDGENVLAACVIVNGRNYVRIRGFAVRNCTESGFEIHSARGTVVQASSVYALSRGFHIWRTSKVVIMDNSVETPEWTARQTDGIYSQENNHNRYMGNKIVISNGEPTGHDDGIQSNRDSYMVFDRNYIVQRNAKTDNAQGIFVTDASGTITVVNNIVYGPNSYDSLLKLLNLSGTSGSLNAYNNTLVGSKWGVIMIENAPRSRIFNNILYTTTENGVGIALVPGSLPSPWNIDHNLYFTPRGAPGYVVDRNRYSWEGWRGLGYETNGILAPPNSDIIGSNLAPVSGSLAIDAGKNLLSPVQDYLDRARPLGSRYDIGAYEGTYGGSLP